MVCSIKSGLSSLSLFHHLLPHFMHLLMWHSTDHCSLPGGKSPSINHRQEVFDSGSKPVQTPHCTLYTAHCLCASFRKKRLSRMWSRRKNCRRRTRTWSRRGRGTSRPALVTVNLLSHRHVSLLSSHLSCWPLRHHRHHRVTHWTACQVKTRAT